MFIYINKQYNLPNYYEGKEQILVSDPSYTLYILYNWVTVVLLKAVRYLPEYCGWIIASRE